MNGVFLSILLAAGGSDPGPQPAANSASTASTPASQAAPRAETAQQKKDEARRMFKDGEAAFEAGNTQLALQNFSRAYELTHLGELLFDIALCQRLLDHWAEARDFYERYLNEVPKGKSRDLAIRQLAEVKQKLVETEAAKPPPPPDLHPQLETVTTQPLVPKTSSPHPSVPAIILGSVGIAAAVVAVVGLVEVLSYHNPTQPTPVAQVGSNVNQANTWATVSLITGIAAGAGLTAAGLTW